MPFAAFLRQASRLLAQLLVVGVATIAFDADAEGPSSRRTHWAITEIQFHPAPRADGRDLEFIELRNTGLITEDLGGHRLTGETEFTFPAGTQVPGGGYVVVAHSPSDLAAVHGLSNVHGPYSGRLNNGGGVLRLINPSGAVLLEIQYRPGAPWPAGTDGTGLSLVLRHASYGEGDDRAWARSTRIGGSPGHADPVPRSVEVRFEEFLVSAASADGSFVEVQNLTDSTLDLGGHWLRAPAAGYGASLPAEFTLGPKARAAVALGPREGHRPAGAGETLLLLDPAGLECLDAIRLAPQAEGVAQGRDEAAPSGWSPLERSTPGDANAPAMRGEIIFNEIMYHPPDPQERGEYVELLNRGTNRVDLGGWRLQDGIRFEFPAGTVLGPGALLVIARDSDFLRARHPDLSPAQVLGPFDGSLANRSERLALERPVPRAIPSAGDPTMTSTYYVTHAEVAYSAGGEWGTWADGGGSSLERVDPRSTGFAGGDWQDSDESEKAPWTTVDSTARLELGVGTADQLQLFALGEGEYLVDDVRVQATGGANRVANGTFDAGVAGWVFRGTHAESRWENAVGALRVVARGRGDSGANRMETPLTSAIASGSTATIGARIRWLRGDPHLLLRLRGNALEAPVTLERAARPGTPGLPNSRRSTEHGPAIGSLSHSPILPPASTPFVITARVTDPDGVASVRLRRRLDPSPSETIQDMNDEGRDGDTLAGDGLYSVTVPGTASGTLHAFRVEAVDASPSGLSRTFPSSEALVRVGEARPNATLGTYRLWMTSATRQRWSSRARLDNTPLPVTFTYNDERVIHGVGALYAGSPHISPGYNGPTGALCGYVLHFPDQEPFLGATEVVLDWPGRDATAQQEPMAYWIARELGIPFNHRRYIRLHVNGITETARGSVYEDAQQVNGDLVESWRPDASGGELYKIEQWFEFDDRLGLTSIVAPRLESYRGANGQPAVRRYRWNWLKRASEAPHDYSNLLNLVTAANATAVQGYPDSLAAMADLEEWMRVFATENIIVNLDAWGYDIGKNMYAHIAPGNRWRLFMWDIDWVMLPSAQHGYSPRSPLMYRGPAPFGDGNRDPVVGRMYDDPMIQRAYWRAIRDAVDGPLLPNRIRTRLTEMHSALVRAGVTMSSGQTLSPPEPVRAWLDERRAYLLEQLSTVGATFRVDPPAKAVVTTPEIVLTGTAPIEAIQLSVNGVTRRADWSAVTRWTLGLTLIPGTNTLIVEARSAAGDLLPGAPVTVQVRYDGPAVDVSPPVIVNEWMAANTGAVRDPIDGDYDDWIELHNPGATTVNLAGWWLTDAASEPDQFVFPSGTQIPGGGFLLLWADGEPAQTVPGGALHLPFRLDRAGEVLTLRSPAGDFVHVTDLGGGTTDRSRGLWPDGQPRTAQDLSRPTPGAPNAPPNPTSEPPRILAIRDLGTGGVELRWSSDSGVRYRVQTTTALEGLAWRETGSDVVATGPESTATVPLPLPAPMSLFLRIVQIP